jgi:hypothetical protein
MEQSRLVNQKNAVKVLGRSVFDNPSSALKNIV